MSNEPLAEKLGTGVIVSNNRIGNGHGLNRSCVTGLFLESILRMAALENSFSAAC